MNELALNNEVTMESREIVKLINSFRKEEDNRAELTHSNFLKSIDKEIEVLENVGISTKVNFYESSYSDGVRNYRCYKLNKAGIMQMLNKESALVRYKTQQYIEALEKEISKPALTKKQQLQLSILNGDELERVSSLKMYETLVVEEATQPLLEKIEEDKPLVDFASRIIKDGDNILVRELAKIATDEGFEIGEKRLYTKLREWNYICKTSTQPTQYAMDRGYFVVETKIINTVYGKKQVFTTKVSPKGQVKIVEKLLKEVKSK